MSRKKLKNDDPKKCAACGLNIEYLQGLIEKSRKGGTSSEFRRALERDHGFSEGRKYFELDHEIPLWAGGEDSKGNTRWLCQACHKVKTGVEAGQRSRQPRKTLRCPDGHEWLRKGRKKWKQKVGKRPVERCWNCPEEK